jgi:alkanesulfonate monooxygenase SsuD/methylene tetrahydromethanopterin reductase-like flavin-dependent oxidoreductase (luciferase family)
MKFGIFALPTYYGEADGTIAEFYQHILELLVDSERAGFDVAWTNEHHFHPYGGMVPFPPVLLSAVAARTSRMRLGTSVALPPLYNPLHLAEAYAMLDQISGGRLEFGVGRGFVLHDYDTFGIPYDESQDRLTESIEVIRKAWLHQPFSHDGRFFRFEDVSVWPPPLQQPHPPIWGACTANPESFAWFGGRGFNLLTVVHVKPWEETRRLIDVWRQAASAAGHNPAEMQVATHYQVYCCESREEAIRDGVQAMIRYRDLNTDARLKGSATLPGRDAAPPHELIAGGRAAIGTPDDIAAMLEHARDYLGLTAVDCTFYFGGLDYAKVRRSFDLFAREVMPRFARDPEPSAR